METKNYLKLQNNKVLTKFSRKMEDYSENFNKGMGNIRRFQTEGTELKSTINLSENFTYPFFCFI